ncbi:hypothetical protein JW978_02200 [Candidatus Dojkabacteria bacterium]|nr:hypothetical protein [Candidatus Dojkabacteria bacterium]
MSTEAATADETTKAGLVGKYLAGKFVGGAQRWMEQNMSEDAYKRYQEDLESAGLTGAEEPGLIGRFISNRGQALAERVGDASFDMMQTEEFGILTENYIHDQIDETIDDFKNGGLQETLNMAEQKVRVEGKTNDNYEHIKNLLGADKKKTWLGRTMWKILAKGLSWTVPLVSMVGAKLTVDTTKQEDKFDSYKNQYGNILNGLLAKVDPER